MVKGAVGHKNRKSFNFVFILWISLEDLSLLKPIVKNSSSSSFMQRKGVKGEQMLACVG